MIVDSGLKVCKHKNEQNNDGNHNVELEMNANARLCTSLSNLPLPSRVAGGKDKRVALWNNGMEGHMYMLATNTLQTFI